MSTGRDYQEISCQLIEVVEQGTFELIHADCPLQDLLASTWPSDMIRHVFKCVGCGREYELSADTYHATRAGCQNEDPTAHFFWCLRFDFQIAVRDTAFNDELSPAPDRGHGHVHVLRMRTHPCGF